MPTPITHLCFGKRGNGITKSGVLQQYVKTQHPGNFTTSDLYYQSVYLYMCILYYNRFSQLGKPSVYHTPRRPQLQFYDVIVSLVIIRLLGHWLRFIIPSYRY